MHNLANIYSNFQQKIILFCVCVGGGGGENVVQEVSIKIDASAGALTIIHSPNPCNPYKYILS